jgi:hypothetical protein
VRTAWVILLVVGAASFTIAVTARTDQAPTPFVGILDEHPSIEYAQRPTQDRVSALARALADGTVTLTYQEPGGYLRAALDALGVAADSQLLVFSKTGIQRASTSPQTPRALYYDDSVVVGFIPGAQYLEIAAHDPEQGIVFYTIDQMSPTQPALTRRTNCLVCHVSASTREVPGLINRSVFTRGDGSVLPQLGSNDVTHRTPLLQRWGGMYVTGKYLATQYAGRKAHQGNVTVAGDPPDPATTSNETFIQWLNSAPETRGYPSAESDIASLMVFDHQVHAINLLTRLNWESRVDGAWREMASELADYLLFVEEAPPPAPLTLRPAFVERFTAAAPQDRLGRSLRELDLEHRLLRYSCSYMIYTKAFERLPTRTKEVVYRRLWAILSGEDGSPKYSHLSAADRRAIVEILRDTKTDLPDAFRSGAARSRSNR